VVCCNPSPRPLVRVQTVAEVFYVVIEGGSEVADRIDRRDARSFGFHLVHFVRPVARIQ